MVVGMEVVEVMHGVNNKSPSHQADLVNCITEHPTCLQQRLRLSPQNGTSIQ